jgi:hypothetical protein
MILGYNVNYEFGSFIRVRPACINMTKDEIFKLTLALYRVTALFPKEESLKFILRQKALEVFSSLSISKGSADLLSPEEKASILKNNIIYIDSIRSLFELAESQDWIDSRNFSTLEREYEKLERILRIRYSQLAEPLSLIAAPVFQQPFKIDRQPEMAVAGSAEEDRRGDVEIKRDFFEKKEDVSLFEKKILETLKERGKMKSSQLGEALPDFNRRSILRKLNELKDKKMIDVSGNGRQTFYFHKS